MKPTLLSFLALIALAAPGLGQSKITLQPNDTIHSVLEQQVGRAVELRMKSGEKMAGKLEKVTDKQRTLQVAGGAGVISSSCSSGSPVVRWGQSCNLLCRGGL